jgi:hypothetical protein
MPRPKKIPPISQSFVDEILALIDDLKQATKDLAKRSKDDRYYEGMANGISVVTERLELMIEKAKAEERAQQLQQELEHINQRLSEGLKVSDKTENVDEAGPPPSHN